MLTKRHFRNKKLMQCSQRISREAVMLWVLIAFVVGFFLGCLIGVGIGVATTKAENEQRPAD